MTRWQATSAPSGPKWWCRRTSSSYIAGCDRVIALVGNAYGWEPSPEAVPLDKPRRSYTQWEYAFARGERSDAVSTRGPVFYSVTPFGYSLAKAVEPHLRTVEPGAE